MKANEVDYIVLRNWVQVTKHVILSALYNKVTNEGIYQYEDSSRNIRASFVTPTYEDAEKTVKLTIK